MSRPLEGRIALVTGASSGIGEATALALAEAGARLAIAARRRDRLEALAAQLQKLGAEPLVLVADLASEAQAQRIVKEAEAHYGRLDILVNNAGVMYLEPVEQADLGRWRRMLELNVLSLIASTQAALPGMRERRDGHVVNISSTAGRIANPNAAAYSATKFGVGAFSDRHARSDAAGAPTSDTAGPRRSNATGRRTSDATDPPTSNAADSSALTTVVPTATTRPPAARVRRTASHVARLTDTRSACILCVSRSSVRSG